MDNYPPDGLMRVLEEFRPILIPGAIAKLYRRHRDVFAHMRPDVVFREVEQIITDGDNACLIAPRVTEVKARHARRTG